MSAQFSILGRGRAGKALAQAWGNRAELYPHTAEPEGWVILAVPDRALAETAARFKGRALHLSGSVQLDGVACAHPLTSFDGSARDYSGTPLAVTGEVPLQILNAFESIGFVPFVLAPEHKALYHAAAVLTSGHVATLWLGALQLLAETGVVLPGRGIWPLAEATLRNVREQGALGRTGPFVRGDQNTIDKDAAALPAAWRELFLKIGAQT